MAILLFLCRSKFLLKFPFPPKIYPPKNCRSTYQIHQNLPAQSIFPAQLNLPAQLICQPKFQIERPKFQIDRAQDSALVLTSPLYIYMIGTHVLSAHHFNSCFLSLLPSLSLSLPLSL